MKRRTAAIGSVLAFSVLVLCAAAAAGVVAEDAPATETAAAAATAADASAAAAAPEAAANATGAGGAGEWKVLKEEYSEDPEAFREKMRIEEEFQRDHGEGEKPNPVLTHVSMCARSFLSLGSVVGLMPIESFPRFWCLPVRLPSP